MRTRIRSVLSGVAVGVLALTVAALTVVPASAAPGAKPAPVPATGTTGPEVGVLDCSSPAHAKNDPIANRQFFDGNSVNIRIAPHLSCNTITGQGQLTHTVDYHCFAVGDSVTRNGVTYTTWTHLRDVTTGKEGWVSDSLLDLNPPGNTNNIRGSLVQC